MDPKVRIELLSFRALTTYKDAVCVFFCLFRRMAGAVELTEDDTPGASLSEPLEAHAVPALRWWLLCRGTHALTSWKKAKLIERYIQCFYVKQRFWTWMGHTFLKSTSNSLLKVFSYHNRNAAHWLGTSEHHKL